MGGRFIQDHFVVQRVVPGKFVYQYLHAGLRSLEAFQAEFTGQERLPQDQQRAGVNAAFIDHELRGFHGLHACATRVNAQIGHKAVLGGDAGQHLGAVPFDRASLMAMCAMQAKIPGWP